MSSPSQPHDQSWQVQDRFLEMHSRWMTLIGEHWQDDRGKILEYWRVEKADSVIVLVTQGDRLLLPAPSYRVGIGQTSLDFAGGRLPEGKLPMEVVPLILQRELGLDASAIAKVTSLNPDGWAVNSSFSNQKLYGFVAELQPKVTFANDYLPIEYPMTTDGLQQLLQSLTCLQCRALLLEWKEL
jgi:hypothetical protein